MTQAQKLACFSLIVCVLTAVTVFTIYRLTGNALASAAGFAWLAALAFGYLYYLRGGQNASKDERDDQIWHRAGRIAFAVFWIVFVSAAVFFPFAVGLDTRVPVSSFHLLAPAGVWLLVFIRSLAALYLYSKS